jgi:hypothetical protein
MTSSILELISETPVSCCCHVDDARSSVLLWRIGWTEERTRNHDVKLCLVGVDNFNMVCFRLLNVLRFHYSRNHR